MIPIWFTIWMLWAFAWLGYESDWMRIRLPVGAIRKAPSAESLFVPFTYNDAWGREHTINPFQPETKAIKLYQVTKGGSYSNRYGITRHNHNGTAFTPYGETYGDTLLSPGVREPLCGWEWLLDREHPPVNCEMTIIAHNCKHTILLNADAHNGNIIKHVCLAALRPNREQRRQIRAINKAKGDLAKQVY